MKETFVTKMHPTCLVVLCLLSRVVYSKEVFYHLIAEEIDWNYGLTADRENGQDNVKYRKAVFREKIDNRTQGADYLGLLGPVIQTEVGDILKLKLENKLNERVNVHITGVSPIGQERDIAVEPGQSYVYTWNIEEDNGPGLNDPECVTSLYYSDVDMVTNVNSGLVGMISICRTEHQPQKQLFLLFNIFDEDRSSYQSNRTNSNRFVTVNGFSQGTMPSIDLCKDNDVIVHLTGLGNDVHTVRVYGHSLKRDRKRYDSVIVYPGSTISAVFKPTEIGTWLVSSQSNDLMADGMRTNVNILRCPSSPALSPGMSVSGTVRRYYMATEVLMNSQENQNASKLGFVPYRNRRFSVKSDRPADLDYLGTMGPLIVVEVGDIAKVVLKNNDKNLHTIHPHGLRTQKRNEGMFYGKDSKQVRQGHSKTYYWMVPENFGPTPYDLPCIPRYYTSGIDAQEVMDGLIGPMLLCQKGMLDFNGNKLSSATKEFFLFFTMTPTGDEIKVNGLPCEQFPILRFDKNEKVRIFALIMGNNGRGMTLVIDGNPFVVDGSNTYDLTLYPGQILSPEISTKLEGKWRISVNRRCEIEYIVGRENVPKDSNLPTPSETHYVGIQEVRDTKRTGERSALRRLKFQEFKSDFYYWHMGGKDNLFGPVIRGVVGGTIKIALMNSGKRNYTMYSPGVVIQRADGDDDLVIKPKKTIEYLWTFPKTSGPGSADQDCIARTYYSTVDTVKDVASGLIGPLIVCKDEAAAAKDIQSKVLLIGVIDETESWYYDESDSIQAASVFVINGYANGSFPDIETGNDGFMSIHLVNIGSRFHAIQFKGAVIMETSQRSLVSQNTVPLFPQSSSFVYLRIENNGQWQYEGMSYDDKEHLLRGILRFEDKNPGPS